MTFWVLPLPTVKFPKLMLAGLAESRPEETAVPESETLDQLVALLVKEMPPANVPAVVGANVTGNVMLCPPDRVRGRASPLILKAVPLMVT